MTTKKPTRKPAKKAAKKAARKAAGKPRKPATARARPAEGAPGPEEELLAANTRFYRALTAGDLEAMVGLWDHGADVMCIHPSGLILREWADIAESWKAILGGTPPKVIPESEQVSLRGDTGCVFCIERIISEAGMGLAGSTNVFRKDEAGAWRMIWHHSALLPSMT